MCSEKNTTMAAVPEELVEEILSRVPVKSLIRFKGVSKKWHSFLSLDHNFAKFHLKQSESENLRLYQIEDETTFKYSNIDDTNSSRKFNFPVEIGTPCQLIGSANGLICVASCFKGGCFIWNPCTGEYKKISVGVSTPAYRLYGFGYDSCSDDYKIVGDWAKHVRIFSLKTNSWRMLEISLTMYIKAVYLNGFLYWCLGYRKMITFDLAKEKFNTLPMPKEIKSFIHRSVHLFVYQGSLCASGEKSIWVMKECGVSVKWTKLCTFVAKEHVNPVGISRLGEVVFCTDRFGSSGVGLVKFDIQGRISDDEFKTIYFYYKRAFVYTESLISPRCFDCLHPLPRKIIKRPRKQRKIDVT